MIDWGEHSELKRSMRVQWYMKHQLRNDSFPEAIFEQCQTICEHQPGKELLNRGLWEKNLEKYGELILMVRHGVLVYEGKRKKKHEVGKVATITRPVNMLRCAMIYLQNLTGVSSETLILGAHERSIEVLYKIAFVFRGFVDQWMSLFNQEMGTVHDIPDYYGLSGRHLGLHGNFKNNPIFGSSNIQWSKQDFRKNAKYMDVVFNDI